VGFDVKEIDLARELAVLAPTALRLLAIIVLAAGFAFVVRHLLRRIRQ